MLGVPCVVAGGWRRVPRLWCGVVGGSGLGSLGGGFGLELFDVGKVIHLDEAVFAGLLDELLC